MRGRDCLFSPTYSVMLQWRHVCSQTDISGARVCNLSGVLGSAGADARSGDGGSLSVPGTKDEDRCDALMMRGYLWTLGCRNVAAAGCRAQDLPRHHLNMTSTMHACIPSVSARAADLPAFKLRERCGGEDPSELIDKLILEEMYDEKDGKVCASKRNRGSVMRAARSAAVTACIQ